MLLFLGCIMQCLAGSLVHPKVVKDSPVENQEIRLVEGLVQLAVNVTTSHTATARL